MFMVLVIMLCGLLAVFLARAPITKDSEMNEVIEACRETAKACRDMAKMMGGKTGGPKAN